MIGVGVVGYGYWGPNLVRNFWEAPNARLVAVCDRDAQRLARFQARYPAVAATAEFEDLLKDPAVDAVAIATPVSSHFELARQALRAGKHVLVEKPMTATSEQALRLIDEARKRDLILMVDHTFVYTGAVRQIHDLLNSRAIGDVYYYDSVRVNLGLFQHDVDVIWDLGVHDLSILNHVIPVKPVAISATGVGHLKGQPENIAYITLLFDGPMIGHIHVNWLAPVKIRRTLISGSRRMIVYDDLEPSEKLKVYDKGLNLATDPEKVYEMLISYRIGDMWAPQIDATEALTVEIAHFLGCIHEGSRPTTDGEVGLHIVSLLEAATQSMKHRGRLVELHPVRVGA
jgi:predicted dehydrogenase